ncbi:hypothetical protein ACSF85_08290 [Moraxella bovoculi]|uniref:hypothetical protein n=1 Tax=Moraxella bovoculi TaxID=386891 RepID=UPI003F4F9027
MRELSLNEIGMVSGGIHDDKGGGGGMMTSVAIGAASGAAGYGASVAGGSTSFNAVDATVATAGGALGGAISKPFLHSHGKIVSAVGGSSVSNFLTSFHAAIKAPNTSHSTNKTGDNYNISYR